MPVPPQAVLHEIGFGLNEPLSKAQSTREAQNDQMARAKARAPTAPAAQALDPIAQSGQKAACPVHWRRHRRRLGSLQPELGRLLMMLQRCRWRRKLAATLRAIWTASAVRGDEPRRGGSHPGAAALPSRAWRPPGPCCTLARAPRAAAVLQVAQAGLDPGAPAKVASMNAIRCE